MGLRFGEHFSNIDLAQASRQPSFLEKLPKSFLPVSDQLHLVIVNPLTGYPILGYYLWNGFHSRLIDDVMRSFAVIFLMLSLAGCADTPQNRELWKGVAAGLQSGAEEMNRQTQEMRNNMNRQSQQQPMPQMQRPTNCTTRYNSMFKEYETVCY